MSTTVSVKYPGVSVVPVSRRSTSVVAVVGVSTTVVKVDGSGGTGTSELAYYQKWLYIDGGCPFSSFADEDVLDGDSVNDL